MIDSLPILLKAIFTHPIFYSLLLADDFEDHDSSNFQLNEWNFYETRFGILESSKHIQFLTKDSIFFDKADIFFLNSHFDKHNCWIKDRVKHNRYSVKSYIYRINEKTIPIKVMKMRNHCLIDINVETEKRISRDSNFIFSHSVEGKFLNLCLNSEFNALFETEKGYKVSNCNFQSKTRVYKYKYDDILIDFDPFVFLQKKDELGKQTYYTMLLPKKLDPVMKLKLEKSLQSTDLSEDINFKVKGTFLEDNIFLCMELE